MSKEQFKTLQSVSKGNQKSAFDLQRFDSIVEGRDSMQTKQINVSSIDKFDKFKSKQFLSKNVTFIQQKLQKAIKKDQRILNDKIGKIEVNSNVSGLSVSQKSKNNSTKRTRPQSHLN
jgi:hypothetical protein